MTQSHTPMPCKVKDGYKIYDGLGELIAETCGPNFVHHAAYIVKAVNEREELLRCFDVRRWTPEMAKAWHISLPDTAKAFEALMDVALTPHTMDKQ